MSIDRYSIGRVFQTVWIFNNTAVRTSNLVSLVSVRRLRARRSTLTSIHSRDETQLEAKRVNVFLAPQRDKWRIESSSLEGLLLHKYSLFFPHVLYSSLNIISLTSTLFSLSLFILSSLPPHHPFRLSTRKFHFNYPAFALLRYMERVLKGPAQPWEWVGELKNLAVPNEWGKKLIWETKIKQ